jgi:hypothetical protein
MSKRVKPISPKDIVPLKKNQIPSEVIAAFNELIAANFSRGYACVKQDNVVELIVKKFADNGEVVDGKPITAEYIFAKHWLDVEDIFAGEGWTVKYDKPGFNESYPACFEFKVGKYA